MQIGKASVFVYMAPHRAKSKSNKFAIICAQRKLLSLLKYLQEIHAHGNPSVRASTEWMYIFRHLSQPPQQFHVANRSVVRHYNSSFVLHDMMCNAHTPFTPRVEVIWGSLSDRPVSSIALSFQTASLSRVDIFIEQCSPGIPVFDELCSAPGNWLYKTVLCCIISFSLRFRLYNILCAEI